jgi:carboxymethylenebutenolidase
LEVFRAGKETTIVTRDIAFRSAVSTVHGYLARPGTAERLPAILLLHDQKGLTGWMKENARDLCSIGYVVLALDLGHRCQRPPEQTTDTLCALADEPTLAELSAAVRWLRRRPDVLPERLGAVGWSWGGVQAVALAATMRLQACVLCDSQVADDQALLAGLQGTPVLGIFAGAGKDADRARSAFRKALGGARPSPQVHVYNGVEVGFMGPPGQISYARDSADKAWVEIYEFLGKHVEDAAGPALAGQSGGPVVLPEARAVATVADLMRAVNEASGVRGTLLKALEREPHTSQQWDRVRANAALLAEAGSLLQKRSARKGDAVHWVEQARGYTADAEAVVAAADQHDYAAAARAVRRLAERCEGCHREHR